MTDEEILEIKQVLDSTPKPHFAEDNEPVAMGTDDLKSILQSWDDKRQALYGVFLILESLRERLGLSKEATLEQIAKSAQEKIISLERQVHWLACKGAYIMPACESDWKKPQKWIEEAEKSAARVANEVKIHEQ